MSSAAWLSLIAKQRAEILFLIRAAPWNITTGAREYVYFSEHGFTTRPDEAVVEDRNRHFDGLLQESFFYERELWSAGTIGGTSEPHNGFVKLKNLDGVLDKYGDPTLYYWPGADIKAYAGGRGFLYSEFEPIFSGTAERWASGTYQCDLQLRDFQFLLAEGLKLPRFRGMGKCLAQNSNVTGWLTVPGPMTNSNVLEFWFRWRSGLVVCRDNTSTSGVGYIPLGQAGGNIFLRWNSATAVSAVPASTYQDQFWHHCAIRVQGTTVEQIVDGVLVNSLTGISVGSPAQPWYFLRNGGNESTDCDVDEIRVWNGNRTNAELEKARELEIRDSPLPSALVTYLPLNGTVNDSTVNGNNGVRGTSDVVVGMPPFASSGEGGPELAGLTKPGSFGAVFDVPGVQPDPTVQVWYVHGGAVNNIVAAKDNGVILTHGTAWTRNNATGAATIITPISKTGPITFDVEGDKTGGVYAFTFAQLLRRWSTAPYGPLTDPTNLDTAAFTATDTNNSSVLGIYLPPGQRPDILTLANEAAAAVGGVFWFKRNGLLTCDIFSEPSGSPVLVLTEQDILSIEPIDLDPPGFYYATGWKRNWTPRDKNTVAGAIQGTAEQAYFENEFRWAPQSRVLASYERPQEELRYGTMHATEAGGNRESLRKLAIYGVPRRGFKIEAKVKGLQADVFNVVKVYHSRHNLSAGVLFRVLQMREVGKRRIVSMEVWR